MTHAWKQSIRARDIRPVLLSFDEAFLEKGGVAMRAMSRGKLCWIDVLQFKPAMGMGMEG